MKFYVRRIAAKLVKSDVLTWTLPYPVRFDGRRG
jgi:hypothetical protein